LRRARGGIGRTFSVTPGRRAGGFRFVPLAARSSTDLIWATAVIGKSPRAESYKSNHGNPNRKYVDELTHNRRANLEPIQPWLVRTDDVILRRAAKPLVPWQRNRQNNQNLPCTTQYFHKEVSPGDRRKSSCVTKSLSALPTLARSMTLFQDGGVRNSSWAPPFQQFGGFVIGGNLEDSFISERLRGIESRRPACGQIRGGQRHRDQNGKC
jgi:hypothetical protein